MMGAEVPIGSYLAKETVLHKLDPRLKLLAILCSSFLVFLYQNWLGLLSFSVMLLSILLVCGIPIARIIRSIRSIWILLLITSLLQFFLSPGKIIAQWWVFHLTDTGLSNGLIFSSRVILLVILLSTLAMTTSPLTLSDGLASILKPFGKLGIGIWKITTVVGISLVFIPQIIELGNEVRSAQIARGAEEGGLNPLKRVRNTLPVVVPVFAKAFRISEELACAMEARAYRGERRTRLHPLEIGTGETLATLAFLAIAILLRILIS